MQKYPERPLNLPYNVHLRNMSTDIWQSICTTRILIYAKNYLHLFRNLKLIIFWFFKIVWKHFFLWGKGGWKPWFIQKKKKKKIEDFFFLFAIANELKISSSCGSTLQVWIAFKNPKMNVINESLTSFLFFICIIFPMLLYCYSH